ncbi:hypothetical protein HMPREF9151_00231 [Hoylesella saccharolytica F0055]|uniref:Uncharacterized protein n=1 Tax=Hoylesella saccharolytica F0055 TaxID=1127699 RepID=L1NJW8_9BACT|nr:hypothetical protein HMPREF9151_00231 [Hoylesella saccharolytica F0055]
MKSKLYCVQFALLLHKVGCALAIERNFYYVRRGILLLKSVGKISTPEKTKINIT